MEDSNENGIIDYGDAKGLFISHVDGTNLKRVSPKQYDLTSWKFITSNSNLMDIIGIEDTNQDKESDTQQDRNVCNIEINLDNLEKSAEIWVQ